MQLPILIESWSQNMLILCNRSKWSRFVQRVRPTNAWPSASSVHARSGSLPRLPLTPQFRKKKGPALVLRSKNHAMILAESLICFLKDAFDCSRGVVWGRGHHGFGHNLRHIGAGCYPGAFKTCFGAMNALRFGVPVTRALPRCIFRPSES
jgi:hypothetical protein